MLITVLGLCVAAAGAAAGDVPLARQLGIRPADSPAKIAAPVDHPLSRDGREGGETVEDAVFISTLPYTDTGATCDNEDDYDYPCPYYNPGAPDVVYGYVPAVDEYLTIDLCGSEYDTRLWLVDADLVLVGCNDDYYPAGDPCGDYVSKIEDLLIYAGATYYIIIDGYSGDCGAYTMEVTAEPWVPCVLECPAGAVLEGEPPIVDGYVDDFNAGCGDHEPPMSFSELWGTGGSSLVYCAVSGWYDDGYRDTDWMTAVIDADGNGSLEVAAEAEQGLYVFELGPQDCEYVAVVDLIQVDPCEDIPVLTIQGTPGDLVWLWAGPDDFFPPAGFVGHEFDYILTISGIEDAVIATEAASWSGVKALYR
jgi:hypothetical protein